MKTIKIIVAIMVVATFMLLIKGCKKVDNTSNSKDVEAVKAAAIQQIKEQYGNISGAVVLPVNKQANEVFYKNAEGKMVNLYGSRTAAPGGINGPNPNCQYNCSNTTNPANLVIVYTMVQAERFYSCEGGSSNQNSTVFVKWTLSAPFAPTFLTSDNVPNTYCTVRFTPSSGSPVNYTVLPAGLNNNFTIKVLGASPVCPNQSLYEISCKINNVPNDYFQSNYTLSSALNLDVQCPLVGNVSASGFVNAPAFSQNGYLPCNRIDKVWPSTSIPATVIGNAAAACTQPSGFNYVDFHQLEYRPVNSSTGSFKWEDQTSGSNISWGVPLGGSSQSPTFSPFNGTTLTGIGTGSGWWLIRYRNIKTGTCDVITPIGSIWPNPALWVTEAWYY